MRSQINQFPIAINPLHHDDNRQLPAFNKTMKSLILKPQWKYEERVAKTPGVVIRLKISKSWGKLERLCQDRSELGKLCCGLYHSISNKRH
ncbi:hypothetical protein DPMN_015878 [Dreissena polymorpha]|uniref:Uncharacterized protein n=1 Tax=Dreissena polymorpha TaxID=45954 RepID=A0A9D4NA11_DREPO|nr:hypothetical protein DPMN_015878 [Dreissena polymorpha]